MYSFRYLSISLMLIRVVSSFSFGQVKRCFSNSYSGSTDDVTRPSVQNFLDSHPRGGLFFDLWSLLVIINRVFFRSNIFSFLSVFYHHRTTNLTGNQCPTGVCFQTSFDGHQSQIPPKCYYKTQKHGFKNKCLYC